MFRVIAGTSLGALTLACLVALGFQTAPAPAIEADRIEEDWSIVVADPDPDVTIPQITMKMEPDPVAGTPYLELNLNYRDSPSFMAGGLQARIRNVDETIDLASQGSEQLNTDGETITWTQRMTLSGGSIHFKITSGTSTTWGPFGVGEGDLSVSAYVPHLVRELHPRT